MVSDRMGIAAVGRLVDPWLVTKSRATRPPIDCDWSTRRSPLVRPPRAGLSRRGFETSLYLADGQEASRRSCSRRRSAHARERRLRSNAEPSPDSQRVVLVGQRPVILRAEHIQIGWSVPSREVVQLRHPGARNIPHARRGLSQQPWCCLSRPSISARRYRRAQSSAMPPGTNDSRRRHATVTISSALWDRWDHAPWSVVARS